MADPEAVRVEAVPEYVEFRGQRWFVADAEWDESSLGVGSHWHLTLTGPIDESGRSVERSPERKRTGRTRGPKGEADTLRWMQR